jgi:aminopeptidase
VVGVVDGPGRHEPFAANTARLAIVGDNPMLMAGQDPAKVSRASKANSIAYQPALEKIAGFDINWNIIAYPGASWAREVFPGDEEDVAVGQAGRGDLRRLPRRQ